MCFVFPILTWCILVLNSAKKKPFRPSRLDTLLQTPVEANTVTFNTIQTVLDASGQWAMATLLLDLMGLSTVKPDPQSFNIATQLHSFQMLSTIVREAHGSLLEHLKPSF